MTTTKAISKLGTLALGISLFAAPVMAASWWTGWDTERDGRLSRTEFDKGFMGESYFKKWDVDGDGRLARNEFDTALKKQPGKFEKRFGADRFASWDVNKDGHLTEKEWNDGTYAAYDRNKDSYLDEPELRDIGDDMGDGGLFDV